MTMPAAGQNIIGDALLDAFQESGMEAVFTTSQSTHPKRFHIRKEGYLGSVWIYVWTLTHGGRPTLPDEYRIQMTSVNSPLALNPVGYTLLLGYEPNLKVFAGFDLKRHATFTTGSPSVQIDIKCLHRALRDGLAFDRKDNQEIAVGIRPDQIMNYLANESDLHRYGASTRMYRLLSKASSLESIPDVELNGLPKERKRIIATINRISRMANFRQKVLDAYGHRCAVTRMQLRLVDAAHILPVGSESSTDSVQNGLALSPTFHRAYDISLIYLDENHYMRINPQKELQLKTLHLDGGLPEFKGLLDKQIHLPADRKLWPDTRFIKQANHFRRIAI